MQSLRSQPHSFVVAAQGKPKQPSVALRVGGHHSYQLCATYSSSMRVKNYVGPTTLLDELLSVANDENFRHGIGTEFGYFGQSAQRIAISSESKAEAPEQYTIVHRYENLEGMGPGTDIAILEANRLGAYAPFVAWVPKS